MLADRGSQFPEVVTLDPRAELPASISRSKERAAAAPPSVQHDSTSVQPVSSVQKRVQTPKHEHMTPICTRKILLAQSPGRRTGTSRSLLLAGGGGGGPTSERFRIVGSGSEEVGGDADERVERGINGITSATRTSAAATTSATTATGGSFSPKDASELASSERQRRVQRVLAQRKKRRYDVAKILDAIEQGSPARGGSSFSFYKATSGQEHQGTTISGNNCAGRDHTADASFDGSKNSIVELESIEHGDCITEVAGVASAGGRGHQYHDCSTRSYVPVDPVQDHLFARPPISPGVGNRNVRAAQHQQGGADVVPADACASPPPDTVFSKDGNKRIVGNTPYRQGGNGLWYVLGKSGKWEAFRSAPVDGVEEHSPAPEPDVDVTRPGDKTIASKTNSAAATMASEQAVGKVVSEQAVGNVVLKHVYMSSLSNLLENAYDVEEALEGVLEGTSSETEPNANVSYNVSVEDVKAKILAKNNKASSKERIAQSFVAALGATAVRRQSLQQELEKVAAPAVPGSSSSQSQQSPSPGGGTKFLLQSGGKKVAISLHEDPTSPNVFKTAADVDWFLDGAGAAVEGRNRNQGKSGRFGGGPRTGRILAAPDEKITFFYSSSVCDFAINDNDDEIRATVTPFLDGFMQPGSMVENKGVAARTSSKTKGGSSDGVKAVRPLSRKVAPKTRRKDAESSASGYSDDEGGALVADDDDLDSAAPAASLEAAPQIDFSHRVSLFHRDINPLLLEDQLTNSKKSNKDTLGSSSFRGRAEGEGAALVTEDRDLDGSDDHFFSEGGKRSSPSNAANNQLPKMNRYSPTSFNAPQDTTLLSAKTQKRPSKERGDGDSPADGTRAPTSSQQFTNSSARLNNLSEAASRILLEQMEANNLLDTDPRDLPDELLAEMLSLGKETRNVAQTFPAFEVEGGSCTSGGAEHIHSDDLAEGENDGGGLQSMQISSPGTVEQRLSGTATVASSSFHTTQGAKSESSTSNSGILVSRGGAPAPPPDERQRFGIATATNPSKDPSSAATASSSIVSRGGAPGPPPDEREKDPSSAATASSSTRKPKKSFVFSESSFRMRDGEDEDERGNAFRQQFKNSRSRSFAAATALEAHRLSKQVLVGGGGGGKGDANAKGDLKNGLGWIGGKNTMRGRGIFNDPPVILEAADMEGAVEEALIDEGLELLSEKDEEDEEENALDADPGSAAEQSSSGGEKENSVPEVAPVFSINITNTTGNAAGAPTTGLVPPPSPRGAEAAEPEADEGSDADAAERADSFPVITSEELTSNTSKSPAAMKAAFRNSRAQSFCTTGLRKQDHAKQTKQQRERDILNAKSKDDNMSSAEQLEPGFFQSLKQEIDRKRKASLLITTSSSGEGTTMGGTTGGSLLLPRGQMCAPPASTPVNGQPAPPPVAIIKNAGTNSSANFHLPLLGSAHPPAAPKNSVCFPSTSGGGNSNSLASHLSGLGAAVPVGGSQQLQPRAPENSTLSFSSGQGGATPASRRFSCFPGAPGTSCTTKAGGRTVRHSCVDGFRSGIVQLNSGSAAPPRTLTLLEDQAQRGLGNEVRTFTLGQSESPDLISKAALQLAEKHQVESSCGDDVGERDGEEESYLQPPASANADPFEQTLSGINASLQVLAQNLDLDIDEISSSTSSAVKRTTAKANKQQMPAPVRAPVDVPGENVDRHAGASSNTTAAKMNKNSNSVDAFLQSLNSTKEMLAKQLDLLQASLLNKDAATAASPRSARRKRHHDRYHDKSCSYTESSPSGRSGRSASSQDDESDVIEERRGREPMPQHQHDRSRRPRGGDRQDGREVDDVADVLLDENGGSPRHVRSPSPHRWVEPMGSGARSHSSRRTRNRPRRVNRVGERGEGGKNQGRERRGPSSGDEMNSRPRLYQGEAHLVRPPTSSRIHLSSQKESEPSSATSSSNYMGKIEPVSFEPVSDSVRAIVAEKVFQLVIDKYPDDRDGDVGCTFQKSKCRLYSANVMDICNTNVLLRPALLVKKMTRHGYFENALRRILPSYQQSLEWGKEIYISAVNDIRRDLDEMFFQMKAARSLVLELIITEPMLAGTGGWNGLYQHGE